MHAFLRQTGQAEAGVNVFLCLYLYNLFIGYRVSEVFIKWQHLFVRYWQNMSIVGGAGQ